MSEHQDLYRAIIRTVVYFDLFDYPLTIFEIWKWLWRDGETATTYREVEEALMVEQANSRLHRSGAFWHLAGCERTVTTREERHRISIQKLKRACRVANLFRLLPWIDGIAACNSLGYRNASAQSDIDLFIIVRPGTIWLTRFLTVGATAFAGQRPTTTHTRDTICLSFFVSRDAMNLEPLALPDGDPYLVYWITQLTPLFGRGYVWDEFYKANAWVTHYLPNALFTSGEGAWTFRAAATVASRAPFGCWASRQLAGWQHRHLPAILRDKAMVGGTDVVANEKVLKFHSNDRRALYRDRWREACSMVMKSTSEPRLKVSTVL